ncbi:MAG: hypothetical protein AB7Q17_12425 [Phycisphaerae bacterium]
MTRRANSAAVGTANSVRELARTLGRSHTAVAKWLNHPAWCWSTQPPWDVAAVRAWAATILSPNPAALDESAAAPAGGQGTPPVGHGSRPVGGGGGGRGAVVSEDNLRPGAVRNATGAGPGAAAPVVGFAESGLDALRRQPLTAAKLKLTVVRAAKLELERDILAGEYVRKSDVEQALVRRVHAVRAAFESLPRQLAAELAALRDANQVEALLEAAIAGALAELSQSELLAEPAGMEAESG